MQSNHCRILKYGPLGLLKIVSIGADGKVKNCMKVQIPFSIYCVHDCDMSEQSDPTHPNKASKSKSRK